MAPVVATTHPTRRKQFRGAYLRLALLILCLSTLAAPAVADDMDSREVGDLLYEDFESSWPPPGWAILSSQGEHGWEWNSQLSHSGEHSARVPFGPPDVPLDEWLVTPAMDFTERYRIYLEFYEEQRYWPLYGENHMLMVGTRVQSDPDSFEVAFEWTPADHVIPGFDDNPTFVDLTKWLGHPEVYLAFRYIGTWADSWYLDDVRVFVPGQRDAAINAVLPKGRQYEGGELIQPRVVAASYGGNLIDFDVELTITESGDPFYFETMHIALAPGMQDTLDFPPYTLSTGHYYRQQAETVMTGDHVPENNVGLGWIDSYTEPHRPLGCLHTNTASGPSAAADQMLDSLMALPGQELSLIRVHTWWPGADPIYEDNIAQNDSLIDEHGADFLPHFWADDVLDLRGDESGFEAGIEERRALRSPLKLQLAWGEMDSTLRVWTEAVNPLDPAFDYRLRLAVTEDSIAHDGGNGQLLHNQALRAMYPDVPGVALDGAAVFRAFALPCSLDAGWDPDRLQVTAFVQQVNSRRVWQAASGRPVDLRSWIAFEDPSHKIVEPLFNAAFPLLLQTGDEAPGRIEVTINFDQSLAVLDSVTSGAWLDAQGGDYVFSDLSDPEQGLLGFSVEWPQGAATGGGELAVCHFSGLIEGYGPLAFAALEVLDTSSQPLPYRHGLGDSLRVWDIPTGIAHDDGVQAAPARARLDCFPNPFNPQVTLRFYLPRAGSTRLSLYDVRGRLLRTLADGPRAAGRHELIWDGRDDDGRELPSGVYLARLESGGAPPDKAKLLLLR